jgi:hypothetical protein
MNAPLPTRVALVATLAATAAATLAFAAGDRLDPRRTGWFLLALGLLFAVRVAGQVVVALGAPRFLPPMHDWNLVPYRILLPVQLLILAVMAWLVASFVRDSGPPVEAAPAFGPAVIAFSAVYATAMAVRYAVRMRRRPEARWFGGAIPIVFHGVLASFLFVLGAFHAAH